VSSLPKPLLEALKEDMKWFWNHYLRADQDGRNPYASPLLAENLTSLPPAFVITAEFDPLRDEGEAYAARLRESGVPVKVTRYSGMIHGFINIADLRQVGSPLMRLQLNYVGPSQVQKRSRDL
jgi:acetyl esterase/lipase